MSVSSEKIWQEIFALIYKFHCLVFYKEILKTISKKEIVF